MAQKRSQPGHGAYLWFRIPLLVCDAPAHTAAVTDRGEALQKQPLSLLLVDDNAMNLKVASLMCAQLWPQASMHSVSSAQSCLIYLENHEPEAILMDLMMPHMNGLQATRTIRAKQDPRLKKLVVIGLTASSHPHDHDECLAAGMNDVLVKPLSKALLQASVERLVYAARSLHG